MGGAGGRGGHGGFHYSGNVDVNEIFRRAFGGGAGGGMVRRSHQNLMKITFSGWFQLRQLRSKRLRALCRSRDGHGHFVRRSRPGSHEKRVRQRNRGLFEVSRNTSGAGIQEDDVPVL